MAKAACVSDLDQKPSTMFGVESDIEYINNGSLWLDLTILVRTLGALTGKNAY
jgi:lipopolysaccharide/colanic/teichoic acid biosynthesis glycosyltransferase